jgi:hypothetical protein
MEEDNICEYDTSYIFTLANCCDSQKLPANSTIAINGSLLSSDIGAICQEVNMVQACKLIPVPEFKNA